MTEERDTDANHIVEALHRYVNIRDATSSLSSEPYIQLENVLVRREIIPFLHTSNVLLPGTFAMKLKWLSFQLNICKNMWIKLPGEPHIIIVIITWSHSESYTRNFERRTGNMYLFCTLKI